MVYIVDPINNTLIDDEKKEVPVRKPGAVPPKTPTIQKFKNGGAPVVPRSENLDERMQRMIYEYDGGPKPKHYDNPNIVDQENLKQPPKKFSSMDPSTYPSNRSQKQKINNWDFIMQSARGNPKEMKEVREILNKSYNY